MQCVYSERFHPFSFCDEQDGRGKKLSLFPRFSERGAGPVDMGDAKAVSQLVLQKWSYLDASNVLFWVSCLLLFVLVNVRTGLRLFYFNRAIEKMEEGSSGKLSFEQLYRSRCV